MPSLFLMIRFLTRWPLPESWFPAEFNEDNFTRGMKWLPLVGLLVGLPAALWLWFASGALPGCAFPGPFLAAALLVWSSGGLHLDGLADTADALFANRSREKTLAIMRDSAVGTGGVIAIALDILGKLFLVSDLAELDESGRAAVVALLAAPICGRMALVWHAAAAPYARDEPGLGAFVNRVGYRHALAATGMALALLLPSLLSLGYGAFRWRLLLALLLCPIALALLFARHLTKKLGGITGDTMGATIELAEITVLFIFLLACA